MTDESKKKRPFILSCLFLPALVFGPAAIVLPFLPFIPWELEGEPVEFADFWKNGGGPFCVLIGALLMGISYGLIKRKEWTKHLILLLVFLVSGIDIYFEEGSRSSAVAFSIFFCALSLWYLYFKKSVAEYFEDSNMAGEAIGTRRAAPRTDTSL